MSKQWYAVYTKPQAEKKVVDNLKRKGIDCFCPLIKQMPKAGLMKKNNLIPLFKSIVFVNVEVKRLPEISRTDQVINFMYWLEQQVIIRDIEMHMMRQFLEDHTEVMLEKTDVNEGAIVRIIKFKLSERRELYKLMLPTLGHALVATHEVSNIKLLDTSKSYAPIEI